MNDSYATSDLLKFYAGWLLMTNKKKVVYVGVIAYKICWLVARILYLKIEGRQIWQYCGICEQRLTAERYPVMILKDAIFFHCEAFDDMCWWMIKKILLVYISCSVP